MRWANAELLARQAKDAMRRLKLTTLKLRLSRITNPEDKLSSFMSTDPVWVRKEEQAKR